MLSNLKKRRNHKGKRQAKPPVFRIYAGNPNTNSASYGVAGFDGKVEIKFDGEMAQWMKEIAERYKAYWSMT